MSMPFPIWGIITDSTGSVVSGAIVWLRNETTNETIYDTTGSDGKYTLEAMNLASGYLTTDTFTVYCNASNEYNEASYLFSSNTHNVDLALVEIEDSSLIYYANVQDVWDELGDKTASDISARRIVKAIQRAESEIDEQTDSAYRPVTVTDEVYDWNSETSYRSSERRETIDITSRMDYKNVCTNDTIKLNHAPIISVTSLSINYGGEAAADSWTALTQQSGSAGDYILYPKEGMIKFVGNLPRFGKRSIKVTYVYGRSTVPKVVNKLTVLLAIKGTIMSKFSGSQIDSQQTISVDGLTVQGGISSGGSSTYIAVLDKQIEDCWKKVGSFVSEVV